MKEGGRKLIVRMMQYGKTIHYWLEDGGEAKEHRQPLEARKGKETGSPPEPEQ